MIDLNGSLKIADFGLSREGLRPNELATTFCGSPEYMAPEMLARYTLSYLGMGIHTLSITIALERCCMS